MGLLAPWFLAGIAAAALPIWLHLLRQHSRTPRPFSSLMFFERKVESSVKHLRFRYLLLLALRLALLFLIALAFANPFVNRTVVAVKDRKLTVIAVDRSFSMRYGDRLGQARREANRVLEGLRGRELAQVLAVDSRIEALTQPETDRGLLSAAIASIEASDQRSSFGEFVRGLRVLGQTAGLRLDVHLVSDMQQTSMPPRFADLQLGSPTTLQLHAIGDVETPNWAIETVNARAHVYGRVQVPITATIAGWQTPAARRTVSLLLDGKTIASKEVNLQPNGREQIAFAPVEVPYGEHQGRIRMEPHDSLANDDEFPFSIEHSDARRILFLYASGRPREAFYYRAAIESATDTGLTIQVAAAERAADFDLSKYAFIVASDLGGIDETVERKLRNSVQSGGRLLISVGARTERAGRVPLTGDSIASSAPMQTASVLQESDPALLGTGNFQNVRFFDTGRLGAKPGERIVARFADGAPLLTEEDLGEGRILTFASTLDDSQSDFCLHPSFLPFIVQTARYLAGADEGPSSVTVGTPIQLRRTSDEGMVADVVGPDEKHELPLNEAARTLSFDVEREGFYEVQRGDGRRELVAAHADRRESDLTRVPEETLKLWRNTGSTEVAQTSAGGEHETRPWSLWRYVMICVLIAAVLESVFASRYLNAMRDAP